MSPAAVAKTVLAVAGVLIFFFGIRFGYDILRWTGIALVAVAFLLRFVTREAPPPDNSEPSTEDSP